MRKLIITAILAIAATGVCKAQDYYATISGIQEWYDPATPEQISAQGEYTYLYFKINGAADAETIKRNITNQLSSVADAFPVDYVSIPHGGTSYALAVVYIDIPRNTSTYERRLYVNGRLCFVQAGR